MWAIAILCWPFVMPMYLHILFDDLGNYVIYRRKKKMCLSHFLTDENDISDKTHLNNIGSQMTKKAYWFGQILGSGKMIDYSLTTCN